jgi:nitroimidazol reductase NimA-like FMN-containing flavoprotein (pyridoxamine 5'-phosphate oxidase superfamily)
MHERGHYDAPTIHAILDAMPLAHVGYVVNGQPYVTPTLQWREGDRVYWHGSAASRMLEKAEGADVCLTVTLIDGLVLARSAFHHSANYRSVMILGRAVKLQDPAEKQLRLANFVNRLFPGRWSILRPMTHQEAKATTVLSLTIDEASAKIRSGGPKDDEEDYALPIWAGVVPLSISVDEPVPDERNLPELESPGYIHGLKIG